MFCMINIIYHILIVLCNISPSKFSVDLIQIDEAALVKGDMNEKVYVVSGSVMDGVSIF